MITPRPLAPRHTPACPLRALFITLSLAALGWAASGCLTAKNPDPVNMSWAERQARNDAQKLEQIGQVMRRDLDELKRLSRDFQTPNPALYQPPFPLDLFKFVAVDCFNEPYQPDQKSSQLARADEPEELKEPEEPQKYEEPGTSKIDDAGLDCRPDYLDRLLTQLQARAPEQRDAALQKLQTLDHLRRLRGLLRYRIAQMPAILAESRRIVASRRQDLRRTRDREARRRTEYDRQTWDKVQADLDDLEAYLDALSQQIDALNERWPDWTPTIEAEISRFYAYLTAISAGEKRSPDEAEEADAQAAPALSSKLF